MAKGAQQPVEDGEEQALIVAFGDAIWSAKSAGWHDFDLRYLDMIAEAFRAGVKHGRELAAKEATAS